MRKWNEEAAPNFSLTSEQIEASHLVSKRQELEFSEELSDGGERNEIISKQLKKQE